jgi:hypothetical protein
MATNLLTTSTCDADNLVAGNLIPQKKLGVVLTSGSTYNRGQLLNIAADGTATLAITPTADALLNTYFGVLLDDKGAITENTDAVAAVTGEFNQLAVLFGAIAEADQPLTILNARKQGLFIAPMNKELVEGV